MTEQPKYFISLTKCSFDRISRLHLHNGNQISFNPVPEGTIFKPVCTSGDVFTGFFICSYSGRDTTNLRRQQIGKIRYCGKYAKRNDTTKRLVEGIYIGRQCEVDLTLKHPVLISGSITTGWLRGAEPIRKVSTTDLKVREYYLSPHSGIHQRAVIK